MKSTLGIHHCDMFYGHTLIDKQDPFVSTFCITFPPHCAFQSNYNDDPEQIQTSAAPVSMSDRINKLQKRLSLFSGDTTDGYYFQVICPVCPCLTLQWTPFDPFACRVEPAKTGAYFPRALNPVPFRIEPESPYPKNYAGRTYAWLNFSHVLGHPGPWILAIGPESMAGPRPKSRLGS